MNLNWFWQRKQDKKQYEYQDPISAYAKKARKHLRQKLEAIQKPGKYTHEMDEEMFNSVKTMLVSNDDSDIEIAREIIFTSKIPYNHMNELITEYTDVILHGPFNFYSSASIKIKA